MKQLLIVDDDEALRGVYRRRLSSTYQIFETGEPEQALGLAMEHRPDAILLDLKMPKFDGFELCRNFRLVSYTSNVPIFVVTGESGNYKKQCEEMGADGYFEKPIDFTRLKSTLAATLEASELKKRESSPLKIRVGLRLHGTDGGGEQFTELVATESVSPQGFQFTSNRDFAEGSLLDVFLTGNTERHVGHARVAERFSAGLQLWACNVLFDGATDWILQKS